MQHFAFGILRQLIGPVGDASFHAQQAFKSRIWDLKVWVPGTRTNIGNNKTRNDLVLLPGDDDAPPVMEMFVNEVDAIAEYGGGYFPVTFRHALVYAERARIDVFISEGDDGLTLTHDQLLALRDMACMGGEGEPMDEEEAVRHSIATRDFSIRARRYCAQHKDITSLHLAVLMMPGVKPLIAATLDAGHIALHTQALIAISRELLEPAWRFSLYQDVDGHASGVVASLKKVTPCFDKASDSGWLNRIRHTYTDPEIGLIELEIDRDPTALTLRKAA
jgi:hypothetical protein